MFGSLSNWVNENVPKPTMPNVNMPTVNMPTVSMPNMPGFLSKNKDVGSEEGVENSEVATSPNDATTEPVNADQVKLGNLEEGAETEQVSDEVKNEETAASEQDDDNKASKDTPENASYKTLENAKEMTKNMGNMLFSFGSNVKNTTTNLTSKVGSATVNATSSIKDAIQKKTIIGDFAKENDKFINDKKEKQRREDAAVAPWVGYNEEEKLKEQILALSSDSRNFLRPPPHGVEFQFDFNSAYPIAMAILEEDSALSEMRFKLVPKQVKEENFWLNYFYRVSLIKQSTQLEELNKQNDSKDANIPSSKQDTVEFVSDSYENNLDDEDLKNELKQLKLDSVKKSDDDIDETEWDIKPEEMENISPEELEKEIDSMLN